ncbi:hypothetical protein G6F57_003232 [Rhizopus arrhizus]|uniref:Arrestin C-terminal-like domain-containing protein n=1 Tax=Rhizopus oryzae TaxID=64495 RepID=A0A9P6XDK6_RHIOR|nr:hypothetical protein G6F21_001723 [Rhizopus arrhizus]KAG1425846.1 hypothetical protein G6F58_001743 [Rhizopus delemar]KAG0817043.1 hypothetical protein G6F20_002706 [Rhizopus arrhizus]KAG0838206.1 hypothetical protein G6F19_003261 [Rhizopus arrhizus]KAG0838584.1 hypothetical protein G6F18_004456 [Rhizopus arrhizus]
MYELKIQLENDTLVIRGSPQESVGCVIRGCVVLITKEALKVKSIHLNLLGKMKIHWNERNHCRHQQRKQVIIHHEWKFLEPQKKLHHLLPTTYLYPFELALPGDLAESFESYSFGSLSYKLKATVERPAFLPNLISRKQFWIIRQPSDALVGTIPVQVSNEWADHLHYTITIPSKRYNRGQDITIDFALMPVHPGFSVRYLSCFLKEYISCCDTHTESRIIRFFRDDQFPSPFKTETITVPSSPIAIQTDSDNAYVRIQHKLNFTMSIADEQGELTEFRASMPIEIVDREDGNELPSYENASQSTHYSPLYLSSSSEDSYPITPSSSSTGQDYFTIQPNIYHNECSRVPSYHTINLQEGLPAYEL